ncbi:MAG: hypothetical protein ISR64_02645 [Deltaproteobacteria bacterium]|nr:hypothetical protein [Deltaproteobacteria bacterium]
MDALQKVREALGDGDEHSDCVARVDALIQANREMVLVTEPEDRQSGES